MPNHTSAATNAHERRRYFRIADLLAVKHRVLSREEADQLEEALRSEHPNRYSLTGTFATLTQQMDGLMRKIKPRNSDIALYLENLNYKLDMLARSLLLEDNEMLDQPVSEVDLSAGGIAFEQATPLKPGSLLELKMLLYPSLLQITALGEVVRCEHPNKIDPNAVYSTAVDFAYIRTDDRELLIQHVIKREAVLLEKRRGGNSPT